MTSLLLHPPASACLRVAYLRNYQTSQEDTVVSRFCPSLSLAQTKTNKLTMADSTPQTTKHQSPTKAEAKASLSSIFFTSRKATAFAYGIAFALIAFTSFLVLNPSGYSFPSSFKTIFFYSSPSNSSEKVTKTPKIEYLPHLGSNGSLESEMGLPQFSGKIGNLEGNQSGSQMGIAQSSKPIISLPQESNQTRNESSIAEGLTSYVALKSIESVGNEKQSGFELMNGCDMFDGKWVRDDAYPLYAAGSCPYIDESFNCFLNNRPDNGYEKYRWQPKDCNLPRFNGSNMLGILRGKRLVFVGDSLNRNMWESLVCFLRNSVDDKSRVFEASGRSEFRTEGAYSFIFKDYNCSVEYIRSPFLVQEWEMPATNGSKKETLRLDMIERSLDNYKSADILIFNTGHWWTHEKTSRGKGYYQEGGYIYGQLNVKEAYRKAITTWANWVDANINPEKTIVFFWGYSPNHFRGGRWNTGGQCHGVTEPIQYKAYKGKYPAKMRILDSVVRGMKTPIFYLNITRMTDFRRDAHPSIYRKQNLTEEERQSSLRDQDCSHWCLPGVPDTWNELLYAQLVRYTQQRRRS